MNNTLDLETSKLIYKTIGDFDTEKTWYDCGSNIWNCGDWAEAMNNGKDYAQSTAPGYGIKTIPAPSLGETIRILPKIGEERGWDNGWYRVMDAVNLACIYISAPSPEEGMKQVGEYLTKLLK